LYQGQHRNKALKFQIPSTKLQINLKIQYPMTKTFSWRHRIPSQTFVRRSFCHLAQMLVERVFEILNLNHWDLFVIWCLKFGNLKNLRSGKYFLVSYLSNGYGHATISSALTPNHINTNLL
jgi:hypothetical protein